MKNFNLIKKAFSILAPKSTVLPILECALVMDNRLTITDLNTSVIIKDIGVDSNFVIDGKSLVKALGFIENPALSLADSRLTISGQDESFEYHVEGVSDFPKISYDGVLNVGKIGDRDIANIQRALSVISKDKLRPAMMMVAITNGHIMGTDAHCAIFEKADFACSKQILIGKKCAKLMALGSNFSVSISETHLVLENSDMIIVQRMDDNRYPDLLAVVPKQPAIEMTVAKKDLEATVKRADVCANPYTRMIVFEVNGRLTISANNLDFDTSYKRQISCEHSGDDLKIGLNSRFLLNLIKTIKSPEITFSFTENTKAFLINKSALQMPVALNQF